MEQIQLPSLGLGDVWEIFKKKAEAFRTSIASYKNIIKDEVEVETKAFQCLECWELAKEFEFETMSENDLKWAIEQIYEPTVTLIIGFAWFKACTKNNNKHFIQLTDGMKKCLDCISGEAGAKGLKLERQRLLHLLPFIAANPWKPGPSYVRTIMSPKSKKEDIYKGVQELFKHESDIMILKRLVILLRSKNYGKVAQVASICYAWADTVSEDAEQDDEGFHDQKLWCDKAFSGDVAVIWLAGAVSLAMKQYEIDKAKPQEPLKPRPVFPPRFEMKGGKKDIVDLTVKEALDRLKITKSCPCSLIIHWPGYGNLYNNILVTAISSKLLDNENVEVIQNRLEEWIDLYCDMPDSEFSPLNLLRDDVGIQSASFYTIADILLTQKRCQEGITVFVKGIICDINRMEALYIADEKQQQEEAWREVRSQLGKKFEQLLDMLPSKPLKKEVILTIFSLNPTAQLMEKLFSSDLKVHPECTSADFKNITVVVDSHEVVLDEWSSYDLLSAIRAPRDKLLSWTSSDVLEHRQVCESYLSSGGKSIIRNDELKNLDIDYSQFDGMPREVLTWEDCIERGYGLKDPMRKKLLASTKVKHTKRKNIRFSAKTKPAKKPAPAKKVQKKSVNSRAGSSGNYKSRTKSPGAKHKTRTGRPTLVKARMMELERQTKRAELPKLKLKCVGLEDDIPPPLSPVGLTRAPDFSVPPEKFYYLVMRETPDQATVNLEPDDAFRLQTAQVSAFITKSDSLYNDLVNETSVDGLDLSYGNRRTTLEKKLLAALQAQASETHSINPLYVQHSKLACAVKLVRVFPDSLIKKFAQSLSFDVLIEIIKESLHDMDTSFSGKSATDLKNIFAESQQNGRPLISHLVEQKVLQMGTNSQTFQFPSSAHPKDYVSNMSKIPIKKQCGPKRITTERYEQQVIDATASNLEKNLVLKRAALGLEFVDGKLVRASKLPFVDMPEIIENPHSESGLCRVKVLPVHEVLRQHVKAKNFDGHVTSDSHHTPAVMSLVKQIVSMVYDIEDDGPEHPNETEEGRINHLERFLRDATIWQSQDHKEIHNDLSKREMPVLTPEEVPIKIEEIPKPRKSRKKSIEPKEPKTLKNNCRWGGKARLLQDPKPLPQPVHVLSRCHATKTKLSPVINQSSTAPPLWNFSMSIPVSVIQSPEATPSIAQACALPHFAPTFLNSNHTVSRRNDLLSEMHLWSNYSDCHIPEGSCSQIPNSAVNGNSLIPSDTNLLPSQNGSPTVHSPSTERQRSSIESLYHQHVNGSTNASKSSQVQSIVRSESSSPVKVAAYVPVIQKVPASNQDNVQNQPSNLSLNCETDHMQAIIKLVQEMPPEGFKAETEKVTMVGDLEQNALIQNGSGLESGPSRSLDNPPTPDSDVSYTPSSPNVSGSGGAATTEFSTEEENVQEKKSVRRKKRGRNRFSPGPKKSKSSLETETEVPGKLEDRSAKIARDGTDDQAGVDLQQCSVLVKSPHFVVHGATAVTASMSSDVDMVNQQRKTLPSPHLVDAKKRKTSPTKKKQLVSRTRGKKIKPKNDSTETEDSGSTSPCVIDLISDEGSNQNVKSEEETPELHPKTASGEIPSTNSIDFAGDEAVSNSKKPADPKDIKTLLCSEELSESTGVSDAETSTSNPTESPTPVQEGRTATESQSQFLMETCKTSEGSEEKSEEAVREEMTNGPNFDQVNPIPSASNDSRAKYVEQSGSKQHWTSGKLSEDEANVEVEVTEKHCTGNREPVEDENGLINGEVDDEVPITIGYDRYDSNDASDDPLRDDGSGDGEYDQVEDPLGGDMCADGLDAHDQKERPNVNGEADETASDEQMVIPEGISVDVEQPKVEYDTPVVSGDEKLIALQPASSHPAGSIRVNFETKENSSSGCNLVAFIGDISGADEDMDEENVAIILPVEAEYYSTKKREPAEKYHQTVMEPEILRRLELEVPPQQNEINSGRAVKNASDISPTLPQASTSDENDTASYCSDEERVVSVCETTEESNASGNYEDPLGTEETSIPVATQFDTINPLTVAEEIQIQVRFDKQQLEAKSANTACEALTLVGISENNQLQTSEPQQPPQDKSDSLRIGSRRQKGEPTKSLASLPTIVNEHNPTCESLTLPTRTRRSQRKEVQITAEIISPTRKRAIRRDESTETESRIKRSARPPKKFDGYEVGVGTRKRRRNHSSENPHASDLKAASSEMPNPRPTAKATAQVESQLNVLKGSPRVARQTKKIPINEQCRIPIAARERSNTGRHQAAWPNRQMLDIGRRVVTDNRASTLTYSESRPKSNIMANNPDADVIEFEDATSDTDAGFPSHQLHDRRKPASISSVTTRRRMARKISRDSSSNPSEVETMDLDDEQYTDLESMPLIDDSSITEGSPPPLLIPSNKRPKSSRRNSSIDYETVDLTVDDDAPPPTLERFDEHDS